MVLGRTGNTELSAASVTPAALNGLGLPSQLSSVDVCHADKARNSLRAGFLPVLSVS